MSHRQLTEVSRYQISAYLDQDLSCREIAERLAHGQSGVEAIYESERSGHIFLARNFVHEQGVSIKF